MKWENDEIAPIETWAVEHGERFTPSQLTAMLDYLSYIRKESNRMNLISRNDLDKLVERHLLDSLTVLGCHPFPPGSKAADIGSGAGFPGIPVAIARPQTRFVLYESRRLKALFLNRVVEKLNLANVEVRNRRWESDDAKYDIVLARAVCNKKELLEIVRGRLNDNGVILHFRKLGDIETLTI